MKKQYITRKCTFDSGHRVMNERMKCFNMHGHTYICHLKFKFTEMEEIGYAIDFKEIKRVGCQFIDDYLDHGFIVNPKDNAVIQACEATGSKIWYMCLNGEGEYCNPSVENIAKEIFLSMNSLFRNYPNLSISRVKLYETPNCYTVCRKKSISYQERLNWESINLPLINEYIKNKGIIEYDDRKIKNNEKTI